MRLRRRSVFLAALLITAPVAAQEQRASIEGTIRDASGAPIANARVAVRSLAGLAVTASSRPDGHYRLPSLPPGRYGVTATVAGFSTTVVRDVDLLLGQALEVHLTMSPAKVQETVTVVAERALIDANQSARSTHIRDEQITKLPRGRDFTSLISQAAGANPEGYWEFRGISIDGSTGSENRFVVDGIETTHLLSGASGMGLITDVVDEVQVKSSGYSAEHGGATGGVVNVITRSGGNRWTGDVRLYYFGHRLEGEPRLFLQPTPGGTGGEYLVFPKDPFHTWEPGFSIGGPVKKDVAWVFASYQPALFSIERTVTFRVNSQTGTFGSHTRTHNGSANVTARMGDKARARVAVHMNPSMVEGVLPFQHGFGNPSANYGLVSRRSNHSMSGTVDYWPTRRLFFSVRAAEWFADRRQEGTHRGALYRFLTSNVGMPGVPSHLQGPRGTTNVLTNREAVRDIVTRRSLHLDGTAFLSAAGRHAFKVGLQLDRLRHDPLYGETGNTVGLFWGQSFRGQRGAFGYYQVGSNGVIPERGFIVEGDVRMRNVALFVQDAWSPAERLTLHLGLRAESERVPSFTTDYGIQPTAIAFGFAQKLAPRLGAAWDVGGDGKWKVYGSWGVFYDTMKYHLPLSAFGGVKSHGWWFTLDTPDWPNLMRPGCPPACPGRRIEGPVDFARPRNTPEDNAIDPALEPFRLQEAVAGIEHAAGRSLSIGVRYIHKQIDRAVETLGTIDDQGNQTYVIGNPGFGRAAQTGFGPAFPKAVRDYDAVELTLDKRLADHWALRASYVWSRLHGNYAGLTDEAEAVPVPNNGGAFDHPFMAFGEDGQPALGPLFSDRPHQLKAHAIYELPFGTTVGTSFRLMSGTPVTRQAWFLPAFRHRVFYRGWNSDGRLPPLSQLDLHVQHDVKLGSAKRLQLSVNVLNLFDQDTPLLRYPYEVTGAIDIEGEAFFRGFDTQQLIEAQRVRRDPLFLMDYAFQLPREVRLGIKLTF